MAKVLISPIGVGQTGEKGLGRQYRLADYKMEDNDKIYTTPFITEAISEHFKIDKVIFVGTSKSMWEDLYEYFSKKNGTSIDQEYWYELANSAIDYKHTEDKTEINKLDKLMAVIDRYLKGINPNATGGSAPIIIGYGLNEMELWKNFSTFMGILDILDDGDEIFIDITHSFRSIPIFMYLILEFIETLKYRDLNIVGMYYGMLEVSDEIGYTPVTNLKPLLDISKWIRGTHDFINFGNGYGISNLLNADKRDNSMINDLSNNIRNISDQLNINYLIELRQEITKIDKLYNKLGGTEGVLIYILPLIRNFTNRFTRLENDSDFQLGLSKWYFENKRYGHGYICLVESILTKLCEVYNLDVKEVKARDQIKFVLFMKERSKDISDLEQLCELYNLINSIRVKIAHASFIRDKNSSTYIENIKKSEELQEKVEKLFNRKIINELDKQISYEEIKEGYSEWKKQQSKRR